jgi:ABC-type polysaccharide/polyol phosphate transport system ATPase subunit
MNAIAVDARGISKSFPVHKYHKNWQQTLSRWRDHSARLRNPVLRDISFQIRAGEKVALVGRNGSGKTTLLRLLAGIYALDDGALEIAEPPCVLFDANVGTIPLLPVIDNVFLFAAVHGIDRALIAPQLEPLLQAAGLAALRLTPFRDLSKGQRQRFALSIFLQTRASFVIFDEALTNLDIGFLNECERYFGALKASSKTVLMTSHDAAFLRRHCDRALWLEQGRLKMDGTVNAVLDAYAQSF